MLKRMRVLGASMEYPASILFDASTDSGYTKVLVDIGTCVLSGDALTSGIPCKVAASYEDLWDSFSLCCEKTRLMWGEDFELDGCKNAYMFMFKNKYVCCDAKAICSMGSAGCMDASGIVIKSYGSMTRKVVGGDSDDVSIEAYCGGSADEVGSVGGVGGASGIASIDDVDAIDGVDGIGGIGGSRRGAIGEIDRKYKTSYCGWGTSPRNIDASRRRRMVNRSKWSSTGYDSQSIVEEIEKYRGVGEVLTILMKKCHISRDDLARMLGVYSKTIRKYEDNVLFPTADQIRAMSLVFGVPSDVILGLEPIGC